MSCSFKYKLSALLAVYNHLTGDGSSQFDQQELTGIQQRGMRIIVVEINTKRLSWAMLEEAFCIWIIDEQQKSFCVKSHWLRWSQEVVVCVQCCHQIVWMERNNFNSCNQETAMGSASYSELVSCFKHVSSCCFISSHSLEKTGLPAVTSFSSSSIMLLLWSPTEQAGVVQMWCTAINNTQWWDS